METVQGGVPPYGVKDTRVVNCKKKCCPLHQQLLNAGLRATEGGWELTDVMACCRLLQPTVQQPQRGS